MNRKILSAFILFFVAGAFSLLRAQNDHYPQFMEMGNQAYNSQKYDLAIEYYNSAIDDKTDCWQAYVGLGNCYYYQKKFKDSLKNYEIALKMDPNNDELVKFVQFLRAKVGASVTPTPTPRPLAQPLPTGLPPLPPPGAALPPPR
jgi:tetratricopeptide (TPR) repeat protein